MCPTGQQATSYSVNVCPTVYQLHCEWTSSCIIIVFECVSYSTSSVEMGGALHTAHDSSRPHHSMKIHVCTCMCVCVRTGDHTLYEHARKHTTCTTHTTITPPHTNVENLTAMQHLNKCKYTPAPPMWKTSQQCNI